MKRKSPFVLYQEQAFGDEVVLFGHSVAARSVIEKARRLPEAGMR
jgi:hypothetical protein